jgi:hypothetical protein
MIRTIMKLCVVVAAVATFLRTTPSYAETAYYASNTGSGANCTLALPCALDTAIARANQVSGTGRVICLNAIDLTQSTSDDLTTGNQTTEIICPQGAALGAILSNGANETLRVDGLTLLGGLGGLGTLRFLGSGTLILENCAFVDGTGIALDIEPNGPLNIVIKNSRISNNAGGVLIKPAAGGSVTATFDGVTIVNNTGGLKTDSTNGAIKIEVSNSTISNNTANGINIIGPDGPTTNIVNLSHDVIASNGQAGIVANGVNTGVFVDTTLFDEDVGGATLVLSSGHVLTYGNNRIIGTAGSGFTSTTPLN